MESVRSRMAVVLVVLAALAFLGAAPARADIISVVATNDVGEPLDESITTLQDNETLWAQVASATGGAVCVHPLPIGEHATCTDPGTWGTTVIAPFTDWITGITDAPLEPGTWALVGVGSLGSMSASSQEFTINPCVGDCPLNELDHTLLKAAKSAMVQGLSTYCNGLSAISMYKALGAAQESYEFAVAAGPGGLGGQVLAVTVAAGTVIATSVVDTLPPVGSPISFSMANWAMCTGLFGISYPPYPLPNTATIWTGLKPKLDQWVKDPPDPGFDTVAQPDPVAIDALGFSALGVPASDIADAKTLDRVRALQESTLHAYERYQGALEAGDTAGVHRQARAIADQSHALIDADRRALEVLGNLSDTLAADTGIPDTVSDPGTLSDIQAASARLRTSGFTATETQHLHDGGLDDNAITQLRNSLSDYDISDLTPGGFSLRDSLTGVQDAMKGEIPALEDFARQAAVIAGRTNQAPTADFTVTHSDAEPLRLDLDDASTDPDGDPLRIDWDFGDGATATGASPSHTYAAAGSYEVTETVSDGATTDILTRAVHVGANAAPTAADDTVTLAEDTGSTPVGVLDNDNDPDGDPLGVALLSGPEHGSASCGDSACSYVPYADYNGPDAFVYTISDGQGGSATATVSVTVTAVNDPPVVNEDELHLPVGAASGLVDVLANDNGGDGDGQTLTIDAIVDQPASGTATLAPGGIVYTPNPGTGGPDAFTYRACDDGTTNGAPDPQCATARVVVHVHTLPPTTAQDDVATDEDTPVTFDVLANDADPEHTALHLDVSALTGLHGAATCDAAGECTYTPAPDFHGVDEFSYQAVDASEERTNGTIHVTVRPVNDDPVAVTDRMATPRDTPATVSVLADDTDVDGDALHVGDASDGAHGAATCTSAGTCTYTPDAGYSGPDSFHYTAADGHGGAATGTVKVVVMRAAQPSGVLDSKGTDFWLSFMPNLGTPELSLFLTGDRSTTGTLSGGRSPLSQPFGVQQGDVSTVAVPVTAAPDLADEVIPHAGLHVSAVDEITAYGLNFITYTTDAFLGLPTDVLGTDYIALGWGAGAGTSEMSVVATTNGTTVTVTPPGQAPIVHTLDRGDVYLHLADSAHPDVTGTTVHATHPVAVFAGNECANIPADAVACDHVVEEMPPVTTWGRQFVTAPLATRSGGDRFRILAAQDGTTVRRDGAVIARLDRGEFGETLIDHGATITADHPVLVAQYANGSSFDDCADGLCDPFEMLIPPFEQFLEAYTVTTPAKGYPDNYVNVVVAKSGQDTLRVDGVDVPVSAVHPIAGSDFAYGQLPIGVGTHVLEADVPFGAFVYGWNLYDGYGYPGGLSLAPIARANRLALSPRDATWTTGTRHCTDAALADAAGKPLPGIRVDFTVTGAHPRTDSVTTAADGVAQLCATATTAGKDTITATSGALSDHTTATWVKPAPPVVTPTPTPSPSPTPTPTPTPTAKPAAPPPPKLDDIVSLPSTHKCLSRRQFTIRIVQHHDDPIASATVVVNGKKVKVHKGKRFTAVVDLRGIRKGRVAVKITIKTRKGRTIKGTRRYHTCAHTVGRTHRHRA